MNPGKRRSRAGSRFRRYVRFSFGPALEVLGPALDRLEALIEERGVASGAGFRVEPTPRASAPPLTSPT